MKQPRLHENAPPDDVFRSLAAEPRRKLLLLLGEGESSVGELADQFDISRPAISKHLAVLREAGLVERREVGRKNLYRLNNQPLETLLAWITQLDRYWARELESIGNRLDERAE